MKTGSPPDFLWKSGGRPMSLKAGNFSLQARTAQNRLRMGKYGTYLEFCRSHEAPKHCQTLDSPTQSCARAHFRSPPGRPQFGCHCNEIWIHCLKEISDRNAVQSNWGQTGGNLKWALAQDWVALFPNGSPFGDPGPHGDLFGDLGPHWVPILCFGSPFSSILD